jgi:hypothetical protein
MRTFAVRNVGEAPALYDLSIPSADSAVTVQAESEESKTTKKDGARCRPQGLATGADPSGVSGSLRMPLPFSTPLVSTPPPPGAGAVVLARLRTCWLPPDGLAGRRPLQLFHAAVRSA